MPRIAKTAPTRLAAQTLVVDNGGYTIKAGFATEEAATSDCHVIPNCIVKSPGGRGAIYIADQLEQCKDTSELAFRRPIEKGHLTSWDAQMDIWKQVFFRKGSKLEIDPHETNLVLTEAPNSPQALQSNTDQVIFEELEFASAYRCIGPSLNAWNSTKPAEAVVVVDSGFSHTTVTPLIRGRPVHSAIRRLDVGGKLLTNRLKELCSLRHWNLMDDSYLVSQIKEDVCFVSMDFRRDLDLVWRDKGTKRVPDLAVDYILPDYRTTFRGHIRTGQPRPADDETCLPLQNERFVVPELLFTPSDIGMGQAGLAETVVQSIAALPQALWPGMLANVLAVGGSTKLPGFVERLQAELRAVSPAECAVTVTSPDDWLGGARLASNRDTLASVVVTRQEYDEHGGAWAARKFASALAPSA